MGDKKDLENGDGLAEKIRKPIKLPMLPKNLNLDEKKYLMAVERGDIANVRRMIQRAHRKNHIDLNCVDSLGRGALTLAIDGDNLEMVELLVVMGVQTKDALLQAINAEFVEAVELLLEHEELIHKHPAPYSWQTVDPTTALFTRDLTPLVLAAHKNNYEIIKILLDRGATLPDPHDIRCGCDECIIDSTEDPLRHSLARLNAYKAMASPSLIALSSTDPILTAFELSWELRNLAYAEQECKAEYLELRCQVQRFAVDLLNQSRSSQELAIILNHDPEEPFEEGDHMKLARLELAVDFKQKNFVAHPKIQQLLASLWYAGVPGFRRKSNIEKMFIIMRVALLFPYYCLLYMVAPNCDTGKLMRKPFMKFLIHASSYLFFLLILILVSQRAEVQVVQLFGPEWMVKKVEEELKRQRGNGPTVLEILVLVYVIGFIWEETQEMYTEGFRAYLRNMWNFIDFTRNTLYVSVALLRFVAYLQQNAEIKRDPNTRFIPREQWDDFDPQLIAEGLFAAANVFSALKLVHLFSINPHLGPLQISLGRMVIDIVKFFFIYSLVLFAFACGLNQLLWYFADLEKQKCYALPGGLPDWEHAGDSCTKWRSFGNVFEASQSLFWASFGMVGLDSFELAGIKSYTRFWGLLMFGSYSVINVIVLLNLLIAMMSNSYAHIDKHSDVEWKYARTRLWMSYFEDSPTLPPPFNILPTPKRVMKIFSLMKKNKEVQVKVEKEKEDDARYTAVMRALVWRYVSAMHRKLEEEPVTEDDINELKVDVSALRYELLDVLGRNGMDVSFTNRKEKAVLGKRMKVWERRLMKDFQVGPVSVMDDEGKPANEDALARFRRIARMAAAANSNDKWKQTLAATGVCLYRSQIGRCRTRESFRSQQKLQQAIEHAKRLVMRSPLPDGSRSTSPVQMPVSPGHTLTELIKDISQDVGAVVDMRTPVPNRVHDNLLSVPGSMVSRSPAPTNQESNTARKPRSRSSSPNRPRSSSPNPGSSPTLAIGDDRSVDPSPLKSKRVTDPTTVPKVVKRKSPSPSNDQQVTDADGCGDAVARPVAGELRPKGTLPPPPCHKAKIQAPTMEITPCTPICQRASTAGSEPAPKAESQVPAVPVPPPMPDSPVNSVTDSTEYLIPTPEPLQQRSLDENIRSIRKTSKTWL
ncbi:transient-receptor-potential-like protein isoform X1 [Pieris napi]|uniref:transient-receptor-potential-like protein isoform X1 n=1 Tax=Pieris napi TaxID=78633 RepID=UPI001FBAF33D|nr:transient-receptor-potential-like protein isoform X1 [Pieris napi]